MQAYLACKHACKLYVTVFFIFSIDHLALAWTATVATWAFWGFQTTTDRRKPMLIYIKLVIPSAKIFQQDAYPPNTGFLPTFFTEHQQNAWKNNSTPKPFQAKPQTCDTVAKSCTIIYLIELDDGKIYRKNLYLMVKTMVSCRFSLKSIHYLSGGVSRFSQKNWRLSQHIRLKQLKPARRLPGSCRWPFWRRSAARVEVAVSRMWGGLLLAIRKPIGKWRFSLW